MSRYAALLRGVNVGNVRLAMADLRRLVVGLGHTEVKTYLQSGNVVFDSAVTSAGELEKTIERTLADEFGLRVPVVVRGGPELAAIAGDNPYPQGEILPKTLLVAFLATVPDPARVAQLTVPGDENVQFTVVGRTIYLHYPDGGYGQTKFHNAYLEKTLGVVSTTRNWRTVRALRELTAD